jgi:hypothetical protein
LQYATLSYMSLYDALFLYGLAVRDAYEETKNASIFMDGAFVWKKMTARQFIGWPLALVDLTFSQHIFSKA